MKNQGKSSLQPLALRLPGQSLDETIQRTIEDEIISYVLIPIILIFIVSYNWWLWYQTIPVPNPVVATTLTIGVLIYCFLKLLQTRLHLKALRLKRDGEKAVGQTLDLLREKGCRVFHDMVEEKFNLDHVIINEHGVFLIETQCYSKPEKGECKIIYSEDGLSVNNYKADRKVLIQVAAQKKWLEKKL